MKLLTLLRKEGHSLPTDVYVTAGISGLANAGILIIVNLSMASLREGRIDLKHLVLFLIAICTYLYCLRYAFSTNLVIFETIIDRIRTRISQKICDMELAGLESIGRGKLNHSLSQDIQNISQFQGSVVMVIQLSFMLFCALAYMAYLSLPVLFVIAAAIGVATRYYYGMRRVSEAALQQASQQTESFMDQIAQIFDGFKELRIHRHRREEIQADAEVISAEVRDATIKAFDNFNRLYVFSQGFFYSLVAVIVFMMPKLLPAHAGVILEMSTSLLFIIGPLSSLVGMIPNLVRANVSADHLLILENLLDEHLEVLNDPTPLADSAVPFQKLSLKGAHFAYPSPRPEDQFQVGPIDLDFNYREILMIIGGNGSGKSTLLKMLTSLYPLKQGRLVLDGTTISPENRETLRQLFSPIFSDFFLFKKLYGIAINSPEEVENKLNLLSLGHKTKFMGDRFSNVDLSTGQRKRLALIVALLEDRPILVFDEWASDQDPEFRAYFYEVLLPELKTMGKTVIFVSHDERFFHVADRVVRMDSGKITSITTPSTQGKTSEINRREHD